MAKTYNTRQLDSFGEQVFLGAVLGGSSIIKSKKGVNYHLAMRNKNPKWLVYKIEAMMNIFKTNVVAFSGSYRCHSYACEYVTNKRKLLYNEDSRKIAESTLDLLRDVGLAIWCVEAGGNTGKNRKNFYLTVTHFDHEDRMLILRYFSTILELPCVLKEYERYARIQFTVAGSERLLEIIEPHIPLTI